MCWISGLLPRPVSKGRYGGSWLHTRDLGCFHCSGSSQVAFVDQAITSIGATSISKWHLDQRFNTVKQRTEKPGGRVGAWSIA